MATIDYANERITLDDIVFEQRNKAYGAYVLRKLYDDYILRALFFSALTFILAIAGPKLWALYGPKAEVEETTEVIVELNDIKPPPPVDPKTPPPPPLPAAPPPPQVTSIKFVPPVVKPDEEVIEDPPKVEEVRKAVIADVTQEGAPDAPVVENIDFVGQGTGDGPGVVEAPQEEIVMIAEQMPEPSYDLAGFLRKNLRYPPQAQRAEVEGVVYISMVVGADGQIRDHKVVKGLGYGTDEEALRVAKMLPPFNPGKQGGRPVTVRMTQPIRFRLAQ